MAQFLIIAKIVLSLFPAIIEAVKAAEAALPQSSQGALKLEAIKVALESAFNTIQNIEGKFETYWPAISGAVGAVVSMFNAAGLFKK